MWYGLETVLETITFLGTTIAVARYLGPEKLGYFSFINYFIMTVTRTAGTGLSSATRKYMAEFLVVDKPGVARAVYLLAYRFQLLGSCSIALGGIVLILIFGDHQFRLMSCILLLGLVPGVMSWVPAEANNAFEDMAPNTISAFGYLVSYVAVIVLTIVFKWDLIGIASATLIGRTTEVILRTIPLHRKLQQFPLEPVPNEIKTRIRNYCQQAVGVQLLTAVVYDRSEFIFLRWLSGLSQVSYYSISIGLVDRLLILPRVFGTATGATLTVEATRDASRVDSIVRNSCRILLLVVIPIHIGAASIAKAAIGLGYDARYAPAAPVMFIAALLGMPRAFQFISETLLRAADRQKFMLQCLLITGLANLVLDYFFIKHFGAIGAAWGNGLAQLFGTVLVWLSARKIYHFHFPVAAAVRFGIAGVIMGVVSYVVSHHMRPVLGFPLGILSGAVVYLLMLKVLHALDRDDRERLALVVKRVPGRFRRPVQSAVNFLTA